MQRSRSAASRSARGCCCAATAGWGEWSPFLEYDAGGRRAVAALRRGGGRRRLAGPGPRRGAGQRDGAAVGPEQAHAIVRGTAAAATAKVKVAEPGQSPRRRPGPGGGGARRARPVRPGAGRRQRRAGRSTTRSRAIGRAGPGRRRAGVRRAAVRHGRGAGRGATRGRRTDRGRRVDPAGVRPLPGPRPRGRRHRGAQGAAARRRARLPADRRGASGCRSWSRRRWRRRSGSLPASRWRRRCPSCRTRAGWRRCAAHRRRRGRALLRPVDGVLPVVRPGSPDPHALDALRRHRRPTRRTGRPGWPRCARCGGSSVVNASTARRSTVVLGAGRGRRPRGGARPRLAERPARLRGVRRRRGRAAAAAHPDRRADRRLPRARADQGSAAAAAVCAPPAPPSPTCTRRCSRRTTRGCRCVVVTADRPARLRGTGRQPDHRPGRRLSGRTGADVDVAPATPSVRAAAVLGAARRGPLHLNVQLDGPAGAPNRVGAHRDGRDGGSREPAQATLVVPLGPSGTSPLGPRTVVVAGDDAGPPARVLAEDGRLAAARRAVERRRTGDERCGPTGCCSPTELGRRRSSGSWSSATPPCRARCSGCCARSDVEVLDADPSVGGGRIPVTWPGTSSDAVPAVDGTDDPAWLDALAGRRRVACPGSSTRCSSTRPRLHGVPRRRRRQPRAAVAAASSSSAPRNPIRDLDLMATAYDVGSRRKVIANRGLSGIDGTVSTAIGASLGRDSTAATSR